MREENERLNAANLTEEERLAVRRRRAMYRCQQRGLLEVDIVLGHWAREHVPTMDSEHLDALDEVLGLETLDLLLVLTKKELPLPEEGKFGQMLAEMREYALSGSYRKGAEA